MILTPQLFRTLIIVALVAGLLYIGQAVIMPIIFSAFVAMFCHPLVKRLEGYGIPFGLAIFMTVLGITLIFVVIIILFSIEGVQIARDLPTAKVDVDIQEALQNPEEAFNKETDGRFAAYFEEVKNLLEKAQEGIIALLPKTLGSVKNMFVFLASVPVYIFFMLFSRKQLRKFYYSCFDEKNKIIGKRVLIQIERVLNEFLKGMGFVVLIISSLTTIGLYLLGIEHALFFGLLAGFLTLVPYLGVIISSLLPAAMTLITKDTYWYALGVFGIFGAVQWIEGNVITPKIMSDQVGLNPLAVILGLVVFGYLGGLLGILITTPTLAMIKTISYYVPAWEPLKKFLKT